MSGADAARNIVHVLLAAVFAVYCVATDAAEPVLADPNLIVVKLDGRYGYISRAGDMVIAPQFDYAGPFYEGLAAVRTEEGKWAYIDTTGAFVIEPVYGHASHFGRGLGFVEQGGRFGFIDKTGRMVIAPRFHGGGSFSGDLTAVAVGDKYGYINTRGEFVIEPQFDSAGDFHEGLARICMVPEGEQCFRSKQRRFGFIDTAGKIVIPARFDYAEHFSEGLAMARVDGRHGFIDRQGRWAIAPDYINAAMAFSEGLARVTTRDDQTVFIDHDGKAVLSAPAHTGELFSEGLVIARDPGSGQWGYMDKSGEMSIPAQYDRALPFKNGIAPAMTEGQWGLINRDGDFIVSPQFDRIAPLR